MKLPLKALRRGFTLLEMTVVMLVGMALAAIMLSMLNQQIAFLKIFRAQSFLNEEVPMISNHVSKLLSDAERFRMHASLQDALAGSNPKLTSSPVLVLNFRQPDGSVRAGILSFETRSGKKALYYYVVPTSGVLTQPEWVVTSKAANVEFYMVSGMIATRVTGPAGEEVFFTGAME
ncbi:MAG: type II secretion system protein [Luteolibacter sp.]